MNNIGQKQKIGFGMTEFRNLKFLYRHPLIDKNQMEKMAIYIKKEAPNDGKNTIIDFCKPGFHSSVSGYAHKPFKNPVLRFLDERLHLPIRRKEYVTEIFFEHESVRTLKSLAKQGADAFERSPRKIQIRKTEPVKRKIFEEA